MKRLKFRCELLSDVILNQKAATEGPNSTLDFIPGSCFLGIVANQYDTFDKARQIEIFHSGKVRFGDAHPSRNGFRSLKTPVAMFYPKLSSAKEECYISYNIPDPNSSEMREKQLKQCRAGFVDFSKEESVVVKTPTNFAIKSAYDRNERRSKDKAMYGYESLQKGVTLYFDVEVDDDVLAPDVKRCLVGEKRIGRSRTAQYGLIKISEADFSEIVSRESQDTATVYADGRLIFLDDCGLPTYQPTARQLGFAQGDIDWSKSQIRTFQYSPWNYQRQSFDTDRCGIEKGSVIFVENAVVDDAASRYVGSYNNEGFGKIIYNPAFLQSDREGLAKYKLLEDADNKKPAEVPLSGTQLLSYVASRKEGDECLNNIYEAVNDWIENYGKRIGHSVTPSQWGGIRSIASKCQSKQDLLDELFDKEITRKDKTILNGYLTHGVASVNWKENGGIPLLRNFIEEFDDYYAVLAVINLASEMGKKK